LYWGREENLWFSWASRPSCHPTISLEALNEADNTEPHQRTSTGVLIYHQTLVVAALGMLTVQRHVYIVCRQCFENLKDLDLAYKIDALLNEGNNRSLLGYSTRITTY